MRLIGLLSTPVLPLVFVSVVGGPSAADQPPTGWFLAGSHPQDYSAGVSTTEPQGGRASAYLAATATAPQGFGTLMQTFGADSHRAKRLRMRGYVKTEAVKDWAGLWMRVDGRQQGALRFDSRPISGTNGWHLYDIVLDVPDESTAISFGILLQGAGKVYVDDITFDVVPTTVETTNMTTKTPPAGPSNLDFEK